MKYLLFGGGECYPLGGGNDFMGGGEYISNLRAEGIDSVQSEANDWWHIFDTESREVIESGGCYINQESRARLISGDKGGEG